MKVEKVSYCGWENCYRLFNDVVDLIVTTDVGPRIIRFGFVGEENEFKEYDKQVGKTGGDGWRIYGGHRLWLAPEDKARTYVPDNSPVKFEEHEKFVRVIQPADKLTGIQKEMDIYVYENQPRVKIVHRLVNMDDLKTRVSPWALSVMKPGGVAVIPMPARNTHEENFLPTGSLAFWGYTDFSDSRWTFGNKFILLHQDETAKTPQKIGVKNNDPWLAYARGEHLFVKISPPYYSTTSYPDFGSALEVFTDKDMLELEMLGPLTTLKPRQSVIHDDGWFLFRNADIPKNDEDVQKDIAMKIVGAFALCKISVPATSVLQSK